MLERRYENSNFHSLTLHVLCSFTGAIREEMEFSFKIIMNHCSNEKKKRIHVAYYMIFHVINQSCNKENKHENLSI